MLFKATAVSALMILGLAACGHAAGNPGVATAGSPAAATTATPAGADSSGLKFAACMREHGIDMPDPQSNDGRVQVRLPEGADPQKTKTAMDRCKQFLPNGGEAEHADPQRVEQARKFAKCMRESGVPNFPDPDANGGFELDGVGTGPDDPKMQAAAKTCARYQPVAPSGGPSQTTGNQ